jgi:endonuclease I
VIGVWHVIDPPDDWERHRNDLTEAVQGKRNPYIDHPELVCLAWGVGCP